MNKQQIRALTEYAAAHPPGHTPGPWQATPWAKTISIDAESYIGLAFLNPYGDKQKGIPGAVHAANARLIAAAPELLAACKAAEQHFGLSFRHQPPESVESDYPWYRALRAAIRKAEGGA